MRSILSLIPGLHSLIWQIRWSSNWSTGLFYHIALKLVLRAKKGGKCMEGNPSDKTWDDVIAERQLEDLQDSKDREAKESS